MAQIIKLFLMSHHIPCIIRNNDAILFYKTVAKRHGMSLQKISKNLYKFA